MMAQEMAQELSINELRRLAALHKGHTPEGYIMEWAAAELEKKDAALRDLIELENQYMPRVAPHEWTRAWEAAIAALGA